jgi:hypothetical protein
MALPKLEGRIQVPSGGWSVSVLEILPVPAGPASVVVAAQGTYYLSDLLSTMAAALTANVTIGTYTVTLDSATGRVTITSTIATAVDITWSSTDLRDALGFTGATTSLAPSAQSTKSSPLVWLPNVPRAPGRAPDGTNGVAMTDQTTTVAPSGHSKTLVFSTRYSDLLAWRFIYGVKSWAVNESLGNESFESWWNAVVGRGQPFRYHPDRTIAGTYVEYRAVGEGASELPLQPADPGWTTGTLAYWNFAMEVIRYVA